MLILYFQVFNVKSFSAESKKYFCDIVLGGMRDREKQRVIRPDLIHLLMELRKGYRGFFLDSNEHSRRHNAF